jgi:tRNA uridine 5-carbamoylmethylation protein Kti12
MLIGLPASGKSTWAHRKEKIYGGMTVSSDDWIEMVAGEWGLTYSEVFKDSIRESQDYVRHLVKYAISRRTSVIWDQTNLTRKVRLERLGMFPPDWEKFAIVFQLPERDVWRKRLDSRPGKVIPEDVLAGMMDRYQEPTIDEGFKEITLV